LACRQIHIHSRLLHHSGLITCKCFILDELTVCVCYYCTQMYARSDIHTKLLYHLLCTDEYRGRHPACLLAACIRSLPACLSLSLPACLGDTIYGTPVEIEGSLSYIIMCSQAVTVCCSFSPSIYICTRRIFLNVYDRRNSLSNCNHGAPLIYSIWGRARRSIWGPAGPPRGH
jgi:hypothetical protein